MSHTPLNDRRPSSHTPQVKKKSRLSDTLRRTTSHESHASGRNFSRNNRPWDTHLSTKQILIIQTSQDELCRLSTTDQVGKKKKKTSLTSYTPGLITSCETHTSELKRYIGSHRSGRRTSSKSDSSGQTTSPYAIHLTTKYIS